MVLNKWKKILIFKSLNSCLFFAVVTYGFIHADSEKLKIKEGQSAKVMIGILNPSVVEVSILFDIEFHAGSATSEFATTPLAILRFETSNTVCLYSCISLQVQK